MGACRLPWMTDGTRNLIDEVRALVDEVGSPAELDVITASVFPKHVEELAALRDVGKVDELRLVVDGGFLARREASSQPAHAEVDAAIGREHVRAIRSHAKGVRAKGPNGEAVLLCSANLNTNRNFEFYERADHLAPVIESVVDCIFDRVHPGCEGHTQAQSGFAVREAVQEFVRLGVQVHDSAEYLPRRMMVGDRDDLFVLHKGSLGGFIPAILARVGSPATVWASGINVETDQVHLLAREVHAGTIEDLRLYLPGALGARKASAGIYATLCAVVRESVIWADTHAKMLLASGPLGTVSCTGSANLAGTGALEFVRVTTDPEMHAHLTALLDSVRPAADPPLPAAAALERARARFERYSGGNAATDAGAAAVQAPSSASPAVVSSVSRLDLSKCWAPPPADETARDEEPFRLNPRQLHIHRAVDGLLPEQGGVRPKSVAVIGGWGGGKTSNLIFLAQRAALERPGRTVLVVVDTNDRYLHVHVPEAEKWLEPRGWHHHVRNREWKHAESGSRIVFVPYFRPKTRSSSHNPLEGINADANLALMDEAQALPKEAADKITGRLRAKGYTPQIVIFGLPVWGAWWGEMAEREGGIVIRGTSFDNAENLDAGFFEAAEARLTKGEYDAMVRGLPTAPEGLVYACWAAAEWPTGNLLADERWTYQPHMEGRICIDPGVEKPHALIIVHDDDPRFGPDGLDIVVAEVGGERMAEAELVRRILEVAWPRAEDAPRGRYLLDTGTIDRAAKRGATSMHAPLDVQMRATRDMMQSPPGPGGGIGVHLHITEGERTIITNGIYCVQRWMEHRGTRRLACLRSVWDAKPSGEGRGLRRGIESYSYSPTTGQPVKLFEDALDALRYDAIRHQWVAKPGSLSLAIEEQETRAAGIVRSTERWVDRSGGGFTPHGGRRRLGR